jgi:hypothetical protein
MSQKGQNCGEERRDAVFPRPAQRLRRDRRVLVKRFGPLPILCIIANIGVRFYLTMTQTCAILEDWWLACELGLFPSAPRQHEDCSRLSPDLHLLNAVSVEVPLEFELVPLLDLHKLTWCPRHTK